MTDVPDVASLLETELADVPEPCAVALSGGIDSASVLFALLELGKDVRAYTFVPEGHVSTDYAIAKSICEQFSVPWDPVLLPTSIDRLKRDLWWVVHETGFESATDVECTWPFLYLFDQMDEPALVTGAAADGHFVLSREARINGLHESVASMDEFRRDLFATDEYAQEATLRDLARTRFGLAEFRVPYSTSAFVSAFMGTSHEQLNQPNQKQPIRDAYPMRMSTFQNRRHTNLHLGDSRIRETVERLLDTDWNVGDWSTSQGIVNAIARREVPEPSDPKPSVPIPTPNP